MSRLAWRFKSATVFETVVFEGMYMSVGDLKREIVEKKGLSRDHAAELLLSEAQTGKGARAAALRRCRSRPRFSVAVSERSPCVARPPCRRVDR